MISLKDIQDARKGLESAIHNTPLIFSSSLSKIAGFDIHLKLENLQKTGSFKIRGAYNKIANLKSSRKKKGVVTASAGNHAQGVAFVAGRFGIKSTIVMPENASFAKQEATRGYGAELLLNGDTFEESFRYAREIEKRKDAVFIHAFDDKDVIAGQGTIGLEILDALPSVGTVIVPIGGGGLISGISIAIKEQNPGIKIIGVEAEGASSVSLSVKAGEIKEIESASTIADGTAVKRVGNITFPLIQRYVDEIVTVEEEEIAAAILLLMERKKIIVEGAGALPLAALLHGKVMIKCNSAVLVLSGGNIDVNIIERIIEKGLVKSGRLIRLDIELMDVPGSLAKLTSLIAKNRANILHISHDRLSKEVPIRKTRVRLSLETKGYEHIDGILNGLKEKGYIAKIV